MKGPTHPYSTIHLAHSSEAVVQTVALQPFPTKKRTLKNTILILSVVA
jgi:hypothetical protein